MRECGNRGFKHGGLSVAWKDENSSFQVNGRVFLVPRDPTLELQFALRFAFTTIRFRAFANLRSTIEPLRHYAMEQLFHAPFP